MDAATANGSESPGTENARRPSPEGPALPYGRAFVVQFTAATDAQLERATGRVEHLKTGRRERFTSIADLLARITAMLGDVQERSGPADRGRRVGGQKSAPGLAPGPPSP